MEIDGYDDYDDEYVYVCMFVCLYLCVCVELSFVLTCLLSEYRSEMRGSGMRCEACFVSFALYILTFVLCVLFCIGGMKIYALCSMLDEMMKY